VWGRNYRLKYYVENFQTSVRKLNVLLAVHHDINFIPVTNLMHKFLYLYNVTVLYMFRAIICSSSGGQIVCIEHVVSSLSVRGHGGLAVHLLRGNFFAVLSQPVYCPTATTTHRE